MNAPPPTNNNTRARENRLQMVANAAPRRHPSACQPASQPAQKACTSAAAATSMLTTRAGTRLLPAAGTAVRAGSRALLSLLPAAGTHLLAHTRKPPLAVALALSQRAATAVAARRIERDTRAGEHRSTCSRSLSMRRLWRETAQPRVGTVRQFRQP